MYRDDERKWGCRAALVVALIGAATILVIFGGLMMAGGGCEGRPQPCVGRYRDVWLILVATGLGFTLVGWAVFALVNKLTHQAK